MRERAACVISLYSMNNTVPLLPHHARRVPRRLRLWITSDNIHLVNGHQRGEPKGERDGNHGIYLLVDHRIASMLGVVLRRTVLRDRVFTNTRIGDQGLFVYNNIAILPLS
jgi:hypothetical protein